MPLTCPRCGGEAASQQNHTPANGTLLSCPYCDATLYCRQGFCLAYEYMRPLIDPPTAKRILRRWFYEKYDRVPAFSEPKLRYIPFWITTDEAGERKVTPAVSLPPEAPPPPLPEGQWEPITPEAAKQKNWPQPTITLESAGQGKTIQEALLVWAPFYWMTYKGTAKDGGAWVQGFLGKVAVDLTHFPVLETGYTQIGFETLFQNFQFLAILIFFIVLFISNIAFLSKNHPLLAFVIGVGLILTGILAIYFWRKNL